MDNDEKDKEILKSEIAYQCERSPKHQSEVEYLKNISKNTDRIKNNVVFFFWLTVI
jgi:phage terminase Nu1 subunit (DNA packaging protein)